MSELQIKLDELQNEKAAKLKPEYLKDGHICMGVLGTLKEGVDTSDATATSADITVGTSAYVNGEKVEGTLAKRMSGSVAETSEVEHQSAKGLVVLSNPSTARYESGAKLGTQESNIANAIGLTPEKLVAGNTVLGVEGTAESGIDTSDATATPDDIISGKTAYVNGERVEGTILDIGEGLSVGFQYENVVNIGPENGLYITSVHPDDVTFAIRKNAQVTTYLPYADTANIIGLTADKIVSGNTILGVEGTAEVGGSDSTASTGIKQFSTKEELDTYVPENGDEKALVYRLGEMKNITKGDTFKMLYFPDKVVLPEPYPYSQQCHWKTPHVGTDDGWATPYGSIAFTDFSFSFTVYYYSDLEEDGIAKIVIDYDTEDGQTYTLNRDSSVFTERCHGNMVVLPVDFWCAETGQTWGDEISLFMRSMELPGDVMDFGLYEYSEASSSWIPMPTMTEATPVDVDMSILFGGIAGIQKGVKGNMYLSDAVNSLFAEMSTNIGNSEVTYNATTSVSSSNVLSFEQLFGCLNIFSKYADTNLSITLTAGEEYDQRFMVMEYVDGVASLRVNYTYDDSCVKVYFHRPMNKSTNFPLYQWITVDSSGNWTSGISEDVYMELDMLSYYFETCTKEVTGYVEGENDDVLQALCYLANKYMKLTLKQNSEGQEQ